MVGMNPRKSIMVIKMIENTGLFVKANKISANPAPDKFNLSDKVIVFSPRFIARIKMTNDTNAVTPVTHAPGPPPCESCPTQAIAVNEDHTNHE